jgi:hypothetical protein
MSKYTKKNVERDERVFLSKAQLKSRDGWSDACLKLFNVTHDKEAVNPVFKCASPLKL